jgi:hypothetical protein
MSIRRVNGGAGVVTSRREIVGARDGPDGARSLRSLFGHAGDSLHRLMEMVQDPRHESVRKWTGRIFVAGMLAYLSWQLSHLGWAEVWAARPRSPAFYLILTASYLTLPLADTAIYSRLWKIGFWRSLPIFLRKRIYNAAFIGYSGEIVLMAWARGRVALPDRTLAHMIKDSNILSAAVSTLATAALVLLLAVHFPLRSAQAGPWLWWAVATVALAAVIPFAAIHRHRFMLLGTRTAAAVFAIHLVRFALTQSLLVALWSVVLPQAGLGALMALLAAQMLISRIPVLPSRDLLFVGVGMGLSHGLVLPQADVAAMLVTASLFQQAMHFAVYVMTSIGPAIGRR